MDTVFSIIAIIVVVIGILVAIFLTEKLLRPSLPKVEVLEFSGWVEPPKQFTDALTETLRLVQDIHRVVVAAPSVG